VDKSDTVGIIVDDMFFASKIAGAAESAGRSIQRIRTLDQLEQLRSNKPLMLIVDLNSSRINPIEAIRILKGTPELVDVPLVGFVSHVQTDLIREAQTVGCDYVLPRSAFTQMLGEILSGNLDQLRRSNQA
jgi:DNA-binding NarL/FixJ family response regulator